MGKTFPLVHFYAASTLVLVLGVAGKPNGLTFTLIHPDLPDSPLFRGTLPYEERIRRLVHPSNARAHHSSSSSVSLSNVYPEIVRPRIRVQSFNYMVKFGIGTFKSRPPYKEYYLDMDTGSKLTWMQCEGCTNCFRQVPKPFPKNSSKSFCPVIFSGGRRGYYIVTYADNTYSKGFLARETFYFNSNNNKIEKVENITFGCGLNNKMEYGLVKNNKIAGIMGLGWGSDSFVNQIGPQSDGKFSYCLAALNYQTASRRIKSYLRFGADIPKRVSSLGITALLRNKKKAQYYLELEGLSLNGQRLDISPEVFAMRGNSGGCTIDSGLGYSRIVKPAYDVLLNELEKHFSRHKNLSRYLMNPLGLGLCYKREKPDGFKNLPNITIHFKGNKADLVLSPEGSFEVVEKQNFSRKREYFCLAMVPGDEKSSIGAHQQTNHRIVYDTRGKQLLFYPENCLRNA
ncbi:Aspartic proteinase [Actinidia chinensis var. chinensis]|uniref:Aspartic proteinase n=1 Tax=Actinidia chinensis var. chinensis TaxID=1590841 RepID=A0A2R6QE94_ACTCC|nr:Aspartic proteinase [Actinidia chinensis var. chinensis]